MNVPSSGRISRPCARQIELADDLRPEQRDDVRADGEAKAREDLFGHRGAAEDVAPLEHEHLAAGAREVGGGVRPLCPPPITTAS